MDRDLVTLIDCTNVVSGTTVVDTAGYNSLTFMFNYAATTTVVVSAGELADGSDAVAVDAQWLIGAVSFATALPATGASALGYVGGQRYVKIAITNPVANTSIYAVGGNLRASPWGSAI